MKFRSQDIRYAFWNFLCCLSVVHNFAILSFIDLAEGFHTHSHLVNPSCSPPNNVRSVFPGFEVGNTHKDSLILLYNKKDSYSLDDNDEEDYAKKLAEAEAAIAAAEEARRKLLEKRAQKRNMDNVDESIRMGLEPPVNSRSRLSRSDAGTLMIEMPAAGVNSSSAFSGAFSLAWFSAILPATFASGGAGLLFMLPFWVAGGLVAKTAVVDPFIAESLSIGQFAWSIQSKYGKRVIRSKDGSTSELRGAKVDLVAIVNDRPQYELRLYSEKGMLGLGLGLSEQELQYLAGELNNHIKAMKLMSDEEMFNNNNLDFQ